jgi:hypothetical protein
VRKVRGNVQIERLGDFQIKNKFKLKDLKHREFARMAADIADLSGKFQRAVDVPSNGVFETIIPPKHFAPCNKRGSSEDA